MRRDVVNMSARIMCWPKYQKEPLGRIYVDQKTKDDASHKIRFAYKTHALFKGKSMKLPIFEPADPDIDLYSGADQEINRILLVHSNPLLLDRESKYQYGSSYVCGMERKRKDALEGLIRKIVGKEKAQVAIIEGGQGSGKTLLAREIAEGIASYAKGQASGNIAVLASQINPLTEKRSFNSWRHILSAVAKKIAQRMQVQVEDMLEKITDSEKLNVRDKLYLIESIFAVKLPKAYTEESQIPRSKNPLSFIKKEECKEEVVDCIIAFSLQLFRMLLGETPDIILGKPGDYTTRLVLFLDDAQKMDLESWKLLKEVTAEIGGVYPFVIMRQDHDGEMEFASKDVAQYFQLLESTNMVGEHYHISGLLKPQIKELIKALGAEYSAQGKAEVKLMVVSEDPKAALKEQELAEQLCITGPITDITDEALSSIITKTEGNTQLTLQLLLSLMRCKCLENRDGTLVPTPAFKKVQELDDWAYVDVPDLAVRANAVCEAKVIAAASM